MKKNNQVRSKYVQDSLADIKLLESKVEETTRNSLDMLLSENIKKELNNILAEAEDGEDYEETEVEDTTASDGVDGSDSTNDISFDDEEGEDDSLETEFDDTESTEGSEGEDGWADFESFKTEDGEYDLRNADRETVNKVYKLLNNDDEVIVTDDNGIINIKDNTNGAEYIVDTTGDADSNPFGGAGDEVEDDSIDFEADGNEGEEDGTENAFDFENGDDDDDDDTVYEITLNDGEEITEDLGYTTNYQKQTAMSTPSNNEPADAKQTYSMDKGVPTGTEKPFGKNTGDKAPFDKNVSEGEEEDVETIEEETEEVDEATNVGGFVQQNSASKSHVPNSSGRAARNQSKGGEYSGTQSPRYSSSQMENIKRKAKAIFEENQMIKEMLSETKDKLYKAAVTNKNLGQVIRLVTENTTTREEKINIIKRFGEEAKTVEQSNQLYESISKDLKKVSTMSNVNTSIDRTLTENLDKKNNVMNETTVYQSKDLIESINLINRMNNL